MGIGLFGAGLLVGAGVTLLLAPSFRRVVREQIAGRVRGAIPEGSVSKEKAERAKEALHGVAESAKTRVGEIGHRREGQAQNGGESRDQGVPGVPGYRGPRMS